MATSSTSSVSVNNNEPGKHSLQEKMQVDNNLIDASGSGGSGSPPPRIPSPMITVTDESTSPSPPPAPGDSSTAATPVPTPLTPTRERKKSPAGGARQRKRSQPVRGDLLPDPDKLLSYRHHDKREEEPLEDPTVPGGQPKAPPEPRQPTQAGQGAERKRSTVTFCPVIETIEK